MIQFPQNFLLFHKWVVDSELRWTKLMTLSNQDQVPLDWQCEAMTSRFAHCMCNWNTWYTDHLHILFCLISLWFSFSRWNKRGINRGVDIHPVFLHWTTGRAGAPASGQALPLPGRPHTKHINHEQASVKFNRVLPSISCEADWRPAL